MHVHLQFTSPADTQTELYHALTALLRQHSVPYTEADWQDEQWEDMSTEFNAGLRQSVDEMKRGEGITFEEFVQRRMAQRNLHQDY